MPLLLISSDDESESDSSSDYEARNPRLLWPSDSTEGRPSPGYHTSDAAAAAAAQALYRCPYAGGYGFEAI